MTAEKKSLIFPSLAGLCVRLALLGLLVIAAPFFSHHHWLIDLLAHFQTQAALCLLILLVITLSMKKGQSSLVIAAILALSLYNLRPIAFNERKPVRDPESQTLKVTTLNVLTSNPEKELVTDYLRKTKSELLVLCETNEEWTDHLISELGDRYPYRLSAPQEGNFGLLILCQFPILQQRTHAHSSYDINLLEITTDTPIGFLRIFGGHPVPPMSEEANSVRNDYLEAITKRAKSSPHPVLVAGDLNVTRWSRHFQDLLSNGRLTDLSDGMGFHTTWKPYGLSIFGLPIDHLLASPGIMTLSYQIGPYVGSDHRPVTAVLANSQ